jgi:hypothetical protein
MSDQESSRVHRSRLSEDERELRSRLTQLVTGHAWVHGTLAKRFKTCGKPNCRCARGELHESVYLVSSDGRGKKRKQLFIPRTLWATVQQWVENDHRIQELLDKLSRVQREKLERREL